MGGLVVTVEFYAWTLLLQVPAWRMLYFCRDPYFDNTDIATDEDFEDFTEDDEAVDVTARRPNRF